LENELSGPGGKPDTRVIDLLEMKSISDLVSSTVTSTTHTFDNVRKLQREVFGARIYAAFHYHHSLVEGFELGHTVAHQMSRGSLERLTGRP
jgi:hypothetical protein